MTTMAPRLRKAVLATHVAASVGWLGAVVAYLPLAVTVLTSKNIDVVRGVYAAMDATVWYALVPLSLASLLTGLISALFTAWGLFRHYWVLFKLVLNLFATAILVGYTGTIDTFTAAAAMPGVSVADLAEGGHPTHLAHAIGGLLVLVSATVLAVYKPRGLTPYGIRKLRS